MSHPIETPRPSRRWLLAAAGATAVALVSLQFLHSPHLLTRLQLYDFVEYWAAGRLLASGENPYDPERMHALERAAGRTEEGILMWNPPWTLPLVLPFGLLSVRAAHPLWLLFHLLVIVFSADRLWLVYGGTADRRWVSWLLALAFLPTYFALTAGQISPLLLLGVSGFLTFVGRRQDALAGAAAALLGVKPHLAYLFWIALLLWSIRERRWRVITGGVLVGAGLAALSMCFDPSVLRHYWHTFTQQPPAQYRSPTLGTVLRLAFGMEHFRLQFLAMLPGLVWFAFYWRRHRGNWNWKERLPLLLIVSLLTTAYGGWPFDLVLLLVAVIQTAAPVARQQRKTLWATAFAAFVGINMLAVIQLTLGVEYFWFIWLTPAVLLAYLVLRGRALGSTAAVSPAGTWAGECAGN